MGMNFGLRLGRSALLVNILGTYVGFVSGVLYIPLLDLLSHQVVQDLSNPTDIGRIFVAVFTIIILLMFVPFCLFYSQNNGYIGDEYAFHLRKRKHSRMELLLIIVKTLAVFGRTIGTGWGRAILNLVLFLTLFLAHFFTSVFYIRKVNYLYSASYACLLTVAILRISECFTEKKYGTFNDMLYILAIAFVFGAFVHYYSYSWVCIYHIRFKINLVLMSHFRSMVSYRPSTTILSMV